MHLKLLSQSSPWETFDFMQQLNLVMIVKKGLLKKSLHHNSGSEMIILGLNIMYPICALLTNINYQGRCIHVPVSNPKARISHFRSFTFRSQNNKKNAKLCQATEFETGFLYFSMSHLCTFMYCDLFGKS